MKKLFSLGALFSLMMVFTLAGCGGGGGGGSDTPAGALATASPDGSSGSSSGGTAVVNQAPVLAPIGGKLVNENELLQFVVTATDPDGNALVYSAEGLPAGATFDPATQTFSWTPNYDQAAASAGNPYSVVFKVQDNGSPVEVDNEVVIITVGNVNRAPTFDPVGLPNPPQSTLYELVVNATDPDGDSIVYTTGDLPTGASFDPATRTFSWMTPASDGYWPVTFYATDNGSPSMQAQMLVLISVGAAPTPGTLIDYIIAEVLAQGFPNNIENSYMANLKNAQKFFYDNQNTYALNEMRAFQNKVQVDDSYGLIDHAEAVRLIALAQFVIDLLPAE